MSAPNGGFPTLGEPGRDFMKSPARLLAFLAYRATNEGLDPMSASPSVDNGSCRRR